MYESSTWDPLFRPRVHSTFYVRRHPCRSIEIHVCLAVLPTPPRPHVCCMCSVHACTWGEIGEIGERSHGSEYPQCPTPTKTWG